VAGPQVLAAAMSGRQLDGSVRHLMNDLGLAPFHPYGPGRLLFRLPPAQTARPERLRDNNRQDATLWRPADLLEGTIAQELIAISAMAPRSR
jgi:hypothetical protein